MPRRKTPSDSNKLKQGRGQGHGENYQPYLTVRDVPSQGLCSRIKGWKTNRSHHLLSNMERDYFYILEWSPLVVDIREQFPLDLDETLSIAERLGIKHPTNPKTKEPSVMTTDFLIDFLLGGETSLKSRSIKSSQDLSSPRKIEKQEIERTWWAEQGVEWGIVTDLDLPKPLVANIKWIHSALNPEDCPGMDSQMIAQAEIAFLDESSKTQEKALSHVAMAVDIRLGLQPGSCLWLVRYLIATRQWKVDMTTRIKTDQPLRFSKATDAQRGIA